MMESKSRWLVGSSSSSVSAPLNKIRASLTLRRAHPVEHLVQAAGGQDPVQSEALPPRVTRVVSQGRRLAAARVLGEVTDGACAAHHTRRGQRLAGEHAGKGGFARTVPADQANAVARGDLK